MSLLNQPEVAGQFETEAETNGAAEQATATQTTAAPTAEAVAAPKAEPQVASSANVPAQVNANTAVGAPRAAAFIAYADKSCVFDTATVEAMSLGAKRVKGELGSAYIDQRNLGGTFQIEVVSFNSRWAIGTGSQNQTSEDKAKFRVSYDNVTISGDPSTTIAQYVEQLKAEGYKDAKVEPYMDLWGFLVRTEKDGEIPLEERELVLVQVSKTSMGAWTNFCATRGMLASKCGVAISDIVEVVAQAQAKGTNKYTNFAFRAPSAKK